VTEIVENNTLSGDLSWPALSADGEMVVFVSDATGKGDLYSYTIRGKNLKQLVSSPDSEMAPRLNDNGKLAYTHKLGGGEDLYVLAAGSSDPTHLIGGNGDQTRPIWAGDSLVFFSNERGTELWDVVVAGSAKTKKVLNRDVRLPFRSPPSLTPDQKWVAYGLNDPSKSGDIWFSKIDGSKTVSFKTGHVACGEPSITIVEGKTFLAYTALPAEGSGWRQLHIRDVSDVLK
jgi:Tol biopolymer transport system component